jgi:hypothetical protein
MPRTLRRALLLSLVCAAAACVAVPVFAGSASAGSAAGTAASATTATAATTTTTAAPTTTQTAPTTTSTSVPVPSTVLYGLGDAEGGFARCVATTAACCFGDPTSCPAGTVAGFWNNPWFKALSSPSSVHRISYVRLFVTIDAVSQFNGSTSSPGCAPSQVLEQSWYDTAGRLHPAGQSLQDLLAGLVQAHADGLTPVVSITGYAVPTSRPSFDAPAPDPTTPGGYWNYRCGVEGILDAISRLPADEQPHVWEPLNEPDTIALYRDPATSSATTAASGSASAADASEPSGCQVTANGVPGGPAKAACDYVLADQLIHQFAGHAGDTLLAGVFSKLSPVYLEQYVSQLASALPGSSFPASWAVHDYSGVTRGYQGSSLADLEAFDRDLGTDTGGRAKDLWITEAGMLLSSRTKLGDCPASGADPAGTVGACINGDAADQSADIAAFFALPSAGVAVPITHLFWYGWQGDVNWDSGLVDAAGVPRSAWCAFFGSGTCAGSANAS